MNFGLNSWEHWSPVSKREGMGGPYWVTSQHEGQKGHQFFDGGSRSQGGCSNPTFCERGVIQYVWIPLPWIQPCNLLVKLSFLCDHFPKCYTIIFKLGKHIVTCALLFTCGVKRKQVYKSFDSFPSHAGKVSLSQAPFSDAQEQENKIFTQVSCGVVHQPYKFLDQSVHI